MRPQLLKVIKEPGHSFNVRQDLVPHNNNRWHYHAEAELIHFKKGEGTQFIGDNIRRFKPGDVVLVGSNLPHYWRFDDGFFDENERETVDVRVAHFAENFWGENFLYLPENNNLKTVLERAKRGLQIVGKPRQIVAELLEQLISSNGSKRIILLMEALSTISDCKQLSSLSSIGYKPDFVEMDNDRINAIYQYSIKNFKGRIQLEEIAEVANLIPFYDITYSTFHSAIHAGLDGNSIESTPNYVSLVVYHVTVIVMDTFTLTLQQFAPEKIPAYEEELKGWRKRFEANSTMP